MENIYEKLDKKIYQLLAKEVKDNNRILDIGCGECELDFYLAEKKRNLKIIGVDIGILEKIKNVKGSSVRCLKKDASVVKGKFDIIISKYSLHEFSTPAKVLKNCYKILKKNGKMIIIDFIKNSLAEKLWGEKYFSLKKMVNMLKEIGFKNIKGHLITKEGPAFVIGFKE